MVRPVIRRVENISPHQSGTSGLFMRRHLSDGKCGATARPVPEG
jgi:hypothetical protein